MKTFAVKFPSGNSEWNAIVTKHDHHQKYKVELLAEEPHPILLQRSPKGEWSIEDRGSQLFSDGDFQQLENAIEAQLEKMQVAKHMLVLTDFSAVASNAARYAAALAQQLHISKLVLYHSYESIVMPSTSFAPLTAGPAASPKLNQQNINALKNDLQDWVPEYCEIEALTDERNLIEAVNGLIEQEEIGLVVAGITGKSNLEKVLAGSNALHLAKACKAPLLIVPAVAAFQPVKTVVLASDLKEVSISTPVFAIKSFLRALGANLLILNVDHERDHLPAGAVKEMSDLHRIWDDGQAEFHYIHHQDRAEGILEFAGQQRAELLITVPKSYGFVEQIFHRSMSKKLAYKSHLPVLMFRPDA